ISGAVVDANAAVPNAWSATITATPAPNQRLYRLILFLLFTWMTLPPHRPPPCGQHVHRNQPVGRGVRDHGITDRSPLIEGKREGHDGNRAREPEPAVQGAKH